jgi:hypothetical protein
MFFADDTLVFLKELTYCLAMFSVIFLSGFGFAALVVIFSSLLLHK